MIKDLPPLRLGLAGAALAALFTLSAPAAADPWHGPSNMPYGHPPCQEYGYTHPHPGWQDTCPCRQADPERGPAVLGGKVLGVLISDLPNAQLEQRGLNFGVQVQRVQADSPAAAAGIQPDDIIVEFAGKPVYSGERLRWLVRQSEAGTPVDIKLQRGDASMSVSATLQAPPPKQDCPRRAGPRYGT